MPIRLLFLGRLEDVTGSPEREVSAAAKLGDVLASLEPELAQALRDPRIRLAVNGVLVPCSNLLVLSDGDEIAFLPPVSGG